jgi:hypothetical protein
MRGADLFWQAVGAALATLMLAGLGTWMAEALHELL